MLTQNDINRIDIWMNTHARPYDLAKWNYLVHNGSKDDIVFANAEIPESGWRDGQWF